MRRDARLRALALALGAALACVAPDTRAPARPERSVLLLVGDDHGLQLGAYGDPLAETPHLDRLAAQGTRFSHAFATVSSCSPSRAVLLTGLHTHQNGQYGLADRLHHQRTFEDVASLPALLRDAGYRTGLLGKKHLAPDSVYAFEVEVPGDALRGNRNVARIAAAAGRFFRESAGRPFFLVVGFADPHRRFEGPRPLRALARPPEPDAVVVPSFLPDRPEVREDLAGYYGAVRRLDEGVGSVLEQLRDAGRAGDTLVIYLSDNGMPFPGAKTNLYDPGIHLPLLVAAPGAAARGVVSRAMVSWVDLAPTVLDWAGVAAPGGATLTGRSWLPILDQPDPAGWDRVFASHQMHGIHMYYPMRAVRTRRFAYIRNLASERPYPISRDILASPTWRAIAASPGVRLGARSLDAYLQRPAEELYDLKTDPGQVRNLADDPAFAPVRRELREELSRFATRTADPWLTGARFEPR